MVKAVQESQSPRQAVEAINQIIGEIGVSHTAILPASSNLHSNSKSKGELGLVLQRFRLNDRHGYFIIDLKPGAPAANSELKLGDEILSLNGVAIERSRRLDISGHEGWYDLFGIEAEPGEVLTIEYLRSPFDDSQVAEIESVAEIGPVESLQASARLIAVGERQVGYLRFWNLMSVSVNGYLAKAIRTEFAECDALILDLRGRGGVVPAVTSINRTVQKIDVPVVVIIDGLTRSAKEMLAFLLKKQDHVVLIGTRTAGAVIGASMVPLPSGNALMLPVASVETLKRFVDGEVLEGVGVQPDEEVDYFPPYSAGIDRMLQAALSRAAELAGCRVDAK
jgi:carboxyl-terminal processing protease